MENGLKKISIATFNVHMWYDGDYVENFDRVLKLVRVSLGVTLKIAILYCSIKK